MARSRGPARGVTLIACRLVTGRTHQLRVHLAARGWPLVGDPVYRARTGVRLPDPRLHRAAAVFDRQALHAWRLSFDHPRSGAPLSFVAKTEVGTWPFISTLAKLQRSVFVNRNKRTSVRETAMTIAASAHAFVSVNLRANQFVSGLALTMLGLGLSGLLGNKYVGAPLEHPLAETGFTWAAVVLSIVIWLVLYFTRTGLVVRSVGENPAAADALGLEVYLVRYGATIFGGMMAGLAGAFLSLAYRPSWSDGMTSGLGWIAVALTIFVAWEPIRAVFGAFFFGLLYHLAFRLQGRLPSEMLLALPYLLVIVVLTLAALRRRQGNAPEGLGLPYERGTR